MAGFCKYRYKPIKINQQKHETFFCLQYASQQASHVTTALDNHRTCQVVSFYETQTGRGMSAESYTRNKTGHSHTGKDYVINKR